jgi:opacity protein-like surface antigen
LLKYKTTYSLLIVSTVFIYTLNAQEIYIGVGAENAYFKNYINNLGANTLDLNYKKPKDFLLEIGFKSNIYESRFMYDVGITYNNYKINTGFFTNNTSIPLNYSLTYTSIKAGLQYAVLDRNRFKLNIHTSLSQDWLISGTSSYLNVSNNLYDDNTFDKTLISYHLGISVEYHLSENIVTYIRYNTSNSFREEYQDSNPEEKYTLRTNALSTGVIIKLNSRGIKCYGGF